MRLSFLIFSLSWHHVFLLALADEITLTRHADGDVFTIPGSCHEACMVLSSDTASPYGSAPFGFMGNISCTCQCNYGLPIFREDLQICVDNIQECDVASFVNSSGLVEKVPYVYLPQYGQIIYPRAEIKFKGVETPVCVITGVQQLSRSGWSELRNISDVEFPLSIYRDEQRTFLKWTGEAKLRETAEGKIVVVKLACRDSYLDAAYRGIFTPCVAFRVAGSPSRNSIKEVSFATSASTSSGLTSAEYVAIGVSSAALALIYLASIVLFFHSRHKIRRRLRDASEERLRQEPESGKLPPISGDGEASGLVKCNPLLAVPRHFESDTNSAISEADLADKLLQSDSEPEIENITSALVHPHEDYVEPQEQNSNSAAIIAERLPEEDVRIVETTENGNQHNVPVFPGTQRRKLYFNPAYFERQLLAVPPPAAIEFLLKIREVISIAKHKMAAKRFVPTLNEIPEETSAERQSTAVGGGRATRRRASSVQNGALINSRKSLRCTGCPGCSHGSSTPNLPTARGLAENAVAALSGESRVRAWLEDVKMLDACWRNLEEERAQAILTHRQHLMAARTRETRDVDADSARLSSKSLPPLLGKIPQKGPSFSGSVNQVFEGDESPARPFTNKRSAWSVTREPGYFERQTDEIAEWARRNAREHEENHANANVRRAIEDSFKKQLEQLQIAKHNQKSNTAQNNDLRSKSAEKTVVRAVEKPKVVNQPSADKSKNGHQETRVLLDINGELSSRRSSDAKRIMDAVIQELVVTKEIERAKDKETPSKGSDYETDSLEESKVSRKSSSSPVSTEKSSPALPTTLPMDEEVTMRNAIIDVQISETMSTKTNTIFKNHNLPEVVPLRPENYTLVSEVYVNDGYASPDGSDDDSGPEIQYEPENPGHLTIKVVDSPINYVKQDESEYEPDTLDRKPMKLKINGDITYEKQDVINELYVDSLERSSQIMLKSKRSFREGNDTNNSTKQYNSLREIYEARLKYQQEQQTQPANNSQEQSADGVRITDEWRGNKSKSNSCKCTSSLMSRYERRQRKADNQPDVVPKPPPPELETTDQFAKNAKDRSLAGAGDPTTCEEAPVAEEPAALVVGKPPPVSRKPPTSAANSHEKVITKRKVDENPEPVGCEDLEILELTNLENERRNEKRHEYRRFSKWHRSSSSRERRRSSRSRSRSRSKSRQPEPAEEVGPTVINVEDSAYVSSPESNGSRRRLLLLREQSSTESDESSQSAANSESGAESMETDSVFFGNFRAERERLATPCRRHADAEQRQLPQQRPINYRAFQIKSRVY